MKILLATGIKEIYQELKIYIDNNPSSCMEILGEAKNRQEIIKFNNLADIAIVSKELPGEQDFFEYVIIPLTNNSVRVILLPGYKDHPESLALVDKCKTYEVSEYIFNDVTIEKIIQQLLNQPNESDTEKVSLKDEKLTILKPNFTENIINFIKNNNKPLVIIDVDSESVSKFFTISSSEFWKCDWRIGLSAAPIKIHKKTELYSVLLEEVEEIEDRDIRALQDIINNSIKSEKKVIIVADKLYKQIKNMIQHPMLD